MNRNSYQEASDYDVKETVFYERPHPQWEVTFYARAVKNTAAAVSLGKPLYEEKDFIKMEPRGVIQPTTIYDRQVDFEGVMPSNSGAPTSRLPDPERFPYEWRKYKSDKEMTDNRGLPLDFANFLNKSEVLMYQDRGIKDVEELAGLSEEAVRQIGGKASKHSLQAKEFLEKHHNLQIVASVIEESRNAKENNEKLAQELLELKNQMEKLTAAQNQDDSDDFVVSRKKLGRPKKDNEEFPSDH